jgi:hypothetical protein
MEHLYIVIYRPKTGGKWQTESNAVFDSKRLADNYAECKNNLSSFYEHVVFEGAVLTPEASEDLAALGKF